MGSPAGWGPLMKYSSLQTSESIEQPSGLGVGPISTGEGAGLSEGLGETLHPLSVKLLEERGVQEETPPEHQLLWWGCARPPLQPKITRGRRDTEPSAAGWGCRFLPGLAWGCSRLHWPPCGAHNSHAECQGEPSREGSSQEGQGGRRGQQK